MLRRPRLATALGVGLLACGDGKDATQLSAAPTEGMQQTSVGAQQPSAGAAASPTSSGYAGSSNAELHAAAADSPCEPGASRCNGARAEKCSPDGVWSFVEECAQCNGFSYCFADPRVGAHCLVPTCCYPERRCDGAYLQQCNQTATGFETIETCASPVLCEIGRSGGSCVSGCERGETRCALAGLERCNDDLTGYELVEACSAGCDLGRCLVADAGADAAGG